MLTEWEKILCKHQENCNMKVSSNENRAVLSSLITYALLLCAIIFWHQKNKSFFFNHVDYKFYHSYVTDFYYHLMKIFNSSILKTLKTVWDLILKWIKQFYGFGRFTWRLVSWIKNHVNMWENSCRYQQWNFQKKTSTMTTASRWDNFN